MSAGSSASPVREALIRHALEAPVPATARAAAAIFLEDTLMVGLAGSAAPDRASLVKAAQQWGQGGQARLWGDGQPATPATAALVNAYQIHCQEFDCVHEPAVVHPMAVIGGALVSWAQAQGGVSGRQLLDAICVAVDAAALLGMMARTPMRFFRPAMCGALGASLGLSRLAGFDIDRARSALGLTYCQISGNMQAHVEGTPGLALQIGVNARAAMNAAELALAGMAGPIDALDGAFGYLELIEGDYNTEPLNQLGQTWQIERVSHKPFPSGRAAHATLDGLARLLARGMAAEDIIRVELYAPALIRRLVDRPAHKDMSASYARLCLPWLVSVLLSRGSIGLADCSEAALQDPARWARIDCLRVHPDDNPDPNALIPQRLAVTTRDQSVHRIDLPEVLGSPQRALDEPARQAKAQACWRHAGIDDERGTQLMSKLSSIAEHDDLSEIFQLLAPPTAAD